MSRNVDRVKRFCFLFSRWKRGISLRVGDRIKRNSDLLTFEISNATVCLSREWGERCEIGTRKLARHACVS